MEFNFAICQYERNLRKFFLRFHFYLKTRGIYFCELGYKSRKYIRRKFLIVKICAPGVAADKWNVNLGQQPKKDEK